MMLEDVINLLDAANYYKHGKHNPGEDKEEFMKEAREALAKEKKRLKDGRRQKSDIHTRSPGLSLG